MSPQGAYLIRQTPLMRQPSEPKAPWVGVIAMPTGRSSRFSLTVEHPPLHIASDGYDPNRLINHHHNRYWRWLSSHQGQLGIALMFNRLEHSVWHDHLRPSDATVLPQVYSWANDRVFIVSPLFPMTTCVTNPNPNSTGCSDVRSRRP